MTALAPCSRWLVLPSEALANPGDPGALGLARPFCDPANATLGPRAHTSGFPCCPGRVAPQASVSLTCQMGVQVPTPAQEGEAPGSSHCGLCRWPLTSRPPLGTPGTAAPCTTSTPSSPTSTAGPGGCGRDLPGLRQLCQPTASQALRGVWVSTRRARDGRWGRPPTVVPLVLHTDMASESHLTDRKLGPWRGRALAWEVMGAEVPHPVGSAPACLHAGWLLHGSGPQFPPCGSGWGLDPRRVSSWSPGSVGISPKCPHPPPGRSGTRGDGAVSLPATGGSLLWGSEPGSLPSMR